MDLGGTWRAAVADDNLRRVYAAPSFDAEHWHPVEVPGHWRSTPVFSRTDGPLLYRRAFTADPLEPGQRAWLEFDGIFYQSDVYLDDAYLGDTEGYFFPHRFEVTDQLADGDEHLLALEVASSPPGDRTAKRNITGVFDHWDAMDPRWNAGGVWRPVRIARTGPVRIHHYRCVCTDASAERAIIALRVVLSASEAGDVDLVTTLRRPNGQVERHDQVHQLAAGENRVEWEVTVENPERWWPRALGAPDLHEIEVSVHERDGGRSDGRSHRIGLRTIELRNWIASVNGERLFLKGSNQGPARLDLAEATEEDFRRDVDLATDAGLDFLRIHAHISRPELYDCADEAGLLLWQDFPLQWGYARQVRGQARRQAREMVDLLAHHPSVAIWCGHNEPFAIDIDPRVVADPKKQRRIVARGIVAHQLPTWNKTRLDASIKRVISKSDSSRPVIAHSGVLPHPPQLDGTDSHLYFGWYHGDERDLPRILATMPRLARFVSEFGAQAVPDEADFCDPEAWPDLDWERLAERYSLQKASFDRHVPPERYSTFAEWAAATQRYQATLIRRHIETLRRLKYRPTGGFAQFCFADTNPSVTWSVLDHERRPKLGYAAMAAACAPVIVVADRLPAHLYPGETVGLDVHVVSDERLDIDGADVSAAVSWTGGGHEQRWTGTIPADECVRIGALEFVVPAEPGAVRLDLVLTSGSATATNCYRSEIR